MAETGSAAGGAREKAVYAGAYRRPWREKFLLFAVLLLPIIGRFVRGVAVP